MQELNGTYSWHYVNNENKAEGLNAGTQYLVCAENTGKKGATWYMQLAYWFEKGDELTIWESNGQAHSFRADSDGFYMVDDLKGKVFYQILGVRYWATIMKPEISPDDVLTIV